MSSTTITLDDALKKEATEVLGSIGLSLSGYCTLALRQLANKRKVPFELVAADPVPTEETRRAMVEAEARELGIIPDDSPSFTNSDDLIASLMTD